MTRPLAMRPTPRCAWQAGQVRTLRLTGVPQWPQSMVVDCSGIAGLRQITI